MARKRTESIIQYRMAQVDQRAHVLLRPKSLGFGMNTPMRLIALLLMLWDEDTVKGRIEWDHDQIADRTGLTVSQVAKALDQLRQIHLVKETAAGPKLTWEPFAKRTLPAWIEAGLLRPKPMSVSPSPTAKEQSDDSHQVAREEGGADADARGDAGQRDAHRRREGPADGAGVEAG